MARTALDDLIDIYREAQLALVKIITGNTGAGTKTYYNSVLKQTEALLNRLSAQTGRYINTEIPKEYKAALESTYDYFKRNRLQMKRPDTFAQVHADAVSELAAEMQHHIDEGISNAGRRVIRYADSAMDNALRQNGLRASAVKIASGQTVRDMQKDLVQRLSEDGFLTVQYGSGEGAYQVGLDSYASMVARSTTREAGNLAREKQLTDNGYDLMIITEHHPCCGQCARVQGRVFSISGNDKRFPPLSAAFPSGYRNVHPNCSCVAVPWIEELQSPEELREAIEKGSQPLRDERSAEEKALYTQQQSDSRQMRADLVQFERYKARLGSDAPKTFSQFRRIKNEDGDKWESLQNEYRQKFEKVHNSSIDISSGSGIIKAGSDDVILENQRYGRNKDTVVNKTYIDSGEYKRKFDNATDNPDVNKSLYNCAKSALKHRSGTELEDMFWLDSETGEVIHSVTDSTDKRAIVYTDKLKKAIKVKKSLITIHSHPSSMPPSIDDFNSSFKNGYKVGFVACHNGKVFRYTSEQEVSKTLYNLYISEYIDDGMSDYDAQLKALMKIKENHAIDFSEVF